MDYKRTCKRRRQVTSSHNRYTTRVDIELHVAKSQNNNIHATPDNCRHVQMYLNAFLGNVLCYIFLPIYAVLPRLFLARDTTLPSDQCLLGYYRLSIAT